MVIGNGMIAKRFSKYADDKNIVVFASGVSNSAGATGADYEREEILLQQVIEQHPGSTLIYFSTCSIYDPSLRQSLYVLHKLKMEQLIKKNVPAHIIFRVSNPVGVTQNGHTVLNYFIQHIKTQQHFTIWQYASRNLIDIDDMYKICDYIINNNQSYNSTINIANPVNYPVINIIEAIENHFGKKGNYLLAEKGNSPLIDTTDIQLLFSKLHIEFNQHYLPALLQKYFPVS